MNIYIVMLIYFLSGAVILYCLQKWNFAVARNIFLFVFGIFSICIPITLGGELVMRVMSKVFFGDEPSTARFFCKCMMRNVDSGKIVFNAATAVIAVTSIIIFVAFIIISVYATIRIVRFIRKLGSSGIRIKFAQKVQTAFCREEYYIYRQKVYLRFCRLLN